MTTQKPLQIIHPPNTLKVKVGGSTGGPDAAAIKRAEQALDDLQGEMQGWLNDELERLDAAQKSYTEDPSSPETRGNLYSVVHDLKGLGATYGFPLIGRIAGSICHLITDGGEHNSLPLALIDAHIDTIRVIVRDDVRDGDDPTGAALAKELEIQVANALAQLD